MIDFEKQLSIKSKKNNPSKKILDNFNDDDVVLLNPDSVRLNRSVIKKGGC